jgi:hypothetical protein
VEYIIITKLIYTTLLVVFDCPTPYFNQYRLSENRLNKEIFGLQREQKMEKSA